MKKVLKSLTKLLNSGQNAENANIKIFNKKTTRYLTYGSVGKSNTTISMVKGSSPTGSKNFVYKPLDHRGRQNVYNPISGHN